MKDKKPSEGAEIQTRPAQTRNKFFWPIVLVAAALTLVLSVGVGRLIGVALLSRSMAQTEVMPTAVPTVLATGSSAGGAMHAVEIPGEGRVIFPKGSSEPDPSPTARVLSVGTPTPQDQPKITPSPSAAATAIQATPSVKVVVSRSTPTPSPAPPSPRNTASSTPKPTFAPIIQITPAPLMGGGG
ncbi:MAG TPA: hypothetical protein VN934_00675 [Candidatus Tumulicola sp.]|nr:hypothetical protein [Candidatus Tumulicola sp.]